MSYKKNKENNNYIENIAPIIAQKKLGQNFLYDEKITDKIVKNENLTGEIIIEIGPGLGLLTKSILKLNPEKIILVEKDPKLVEILNNKFPSKDYPNLSIIEYDALLFKISSFFPGKKKTIISNLPYNISVKLLTNWFDEISEINFMILMFQKEVAQRLSAKHSTKAYGSLSIITQWLFDISHKFDLPPGAFNPMPKIYSSILRFIPRENVLFPAERIKIEKLSKILFAKRRKMLKSILKNEIDNLDKIFEDLNIDAYKRPENLSIQEFCLLSSYI